MPRFNNLPGRGRDYLRGFGAQFWNTGASIYGAHAGSEQSRASALPSRARSSGAIRPGSRFIRSAKSCHTRTTALPSIRLVSIVTASRSRASTIASAKTNAR